MCLERSMDTYPRRNTSQGFFGKNSHECRGMLRLKPHTVQYGVVEGADVFNAPYYVLNTHSVQGLYYGLHPYSCVTNNKTKKFTQV